MSEKLIWHTAQRKISELVPMSNNPRRLTGPQEEQLRKSLEKFDLVEIPAIDFDNTILAGHQRLKVMALMGRGDEVIDVRIPNRKLTSRERNEYNLRSNKTTGEWDSALLAEQDPDLLKEVGFDDPLDNGDNEPGEGGGEAGTGGRKVTCPECGHEFTPKKNNDE